MESWRRERGEVMGVRSETGRAGEVDGWGGVVVGGGGGGLSPGVVLLAGGGGERVIMRMIGSFWRDSMGGLCAAWAGDLVEEEGGCGMDADPRGNVGWWEGLFVDRRVWRM